MHLELENMLWTALQLARKTGNEFIVYLLMMAVMECRSREPSDLSQEEREELTLAE